VAPGNQEITEKNNKSYTRRGALSIPMPVVHLKTLLFLNKETDNAIGTI